VSQLLLFVADGPRSLKEIISIAPHEAQCFVQEAGGAINWLQQYSELFAISGQQGKEVVTVRVCMAADSSLKQIPAQCKDDMTQEVVLRGLPYKATEKDIRQFLGRFVSMLKGDTPIQLVSSRGKRPSGFAKIQLNSPESARDACKCLHNCLMSDRYIEVFLADDKKCKHIAKILAVADCASPADAVNSQEDQQARSAVVQECRDFMERSGCNPLLLSMLGGALSNASRLYLKRANQGLKQLLHEHPEEFEISGACQRQRVRRVSTLAPSEIQPSDCKSGDIATYPVTYPNNGCITPNHSRTGIIELHRLLGFSSKEVGSALFEEPSTTNFDGKTPPETPKLESPNIPLAALQTPSNWGTPATPGDHGDLSHNAQNVAHGLQSQWALSSNLDSILDLGTEQDFLASLSAHVPAKYPESILARVDTMPTCSTQSTSASLKFERGCSWQELFEFLSDEHSRTDHSSHALIHSIGRNFHSPEPSTRNFAN